MARIDETKDGFFHRLDERTGKPSKFWWTSVGSRRVSTGCRDLEAARLWRREREREAADPTYAATRSTTLKLAIERFVTELEVAQRASATLSFYAQKLGPALTFFGEGATLNDITTARLTDYVKWRTTEHALDDGGMQLAVTPRTAKMEIESLLTMLRAAKHRKDYAGDIDALKPLRMDAKYEPRKRFPTREQFVAIVQELERRGLHHRAAWLCVAIATAGRLSEINRFRRSAIGTKVFTIEVTKTKKTEGGQRVRPILPFARELLTYAKQWGAGEGDALLQPWVAANLNDTLRRVCEAVGAPRFSANDFRRALASWLVQAGVAPNLVAYMLGHTSTAMVERVYGKMTAEAAAALIEGSLATRTDSVPLLPAKGPSEPEEVEADGHGSSEEPGGAAQAADAAGVLIPLIVVRIHASEPSGSSNEIGPVPPAYDGPVSSDDPLSGFVAGLIARRRALPALLAGDRPGLARAVAAIMQLKGEPVTAEQVLASMVGGAS
jgi:integrase